MRLTVASEVEERFPDLRIAVGATRAVKVEATDSTLKELVKTLIAMGVFDADRIIRDPTSRFAREGETFIELWSWSLSNSWYTQKLTYGDQLV